MTAANWKKHLFGGRFRRLFWFFWVSLGVMLAAIYVFITYVYYPAPSLPRSEKRLLEWGWHTPRLQDIPQYIDIAQSLPFDGLVIDIVTPRDRRGLAWTIFGDNPVDNSELEILSTEFSGFNWGRLTDNFLRVNVFPADVDWFEDFDTILLNLEAVAKLAHDLEFVGIMFDTEQYSDVRIFEYPTLTLANRYTFDDYSDQVFERGQAVMAALNRGFPGLTVLYTFGVTIAAQPDALANLPNHEYGLLIPFIEGMIEAANEDNVLVDAFESSYIFKYEPQFSQAYTLIKGFTRDFYTRNPQRYGETMQAGFGLWLDHNYCNEPGLEPQGCPSGHNPETFERTVDLALRYSDRYVWIYSQGVNWYTGEGIPEQWQQTLDSIGQ